MSKATISAILLCMTLLSGPFGPREGLTQQRDEVATLMKELEAELIWLTSGLLNGM